MNNEAVRVVWQPYLLNTESSRVAEYSDKVYTKREDAINHYDSSFDKNYIKRVKKLYINNKGYNDE